MLHYICHGAVRKILSPLESEIKNYGESLMKTGIKRIAYAALTASMYVALTVAFAPISYGMVQFRISEALTVLPFFTPAAIYGLFVGCLISNIFGGNGIYDIVFGSIATLIAALATYRARSKYLAPLPPVLINAVMIGTMLSLLYDLNIMLCVLSVGFGQIVVLYGLGLPLIYLLEPRSTVLFSGVLSKYRK